MDEVFWARVGTSGGVGLPGGTVVVSSEGLMADLKPYRLLKGGDGEYWFDGHFPAAVYDAIIAANAGIEGIRVESGKTVAGNEFFLEQFRLDGAVCLETLSPSRPGWVARRQRRAQHRDGGGHDGGYLNHWGFSKFAMICATLLNRLEGDQVTATPEQLHSSARTPASSCSTTSSPPCCRPSVATHAPRPAATTPGGQMSDPIDWDALHAAAVACLPNSYSPYSNFPVGVAGFADDGRIVSGANVENASYGLTLCAECSMVSTWRHRRRQVGGRLLRGRRRQRAHALRSLPAAAVGVRRSRHAADDARGRADHEGRPSQAFGPENLDKAGV